MDMGEPQLIFEDDDLLVVDKPGGMVCHSAQRPEHPTLVAWLRERGVDVPRLINRLDRETSGIVVVAKHERAARNLGKSMQRGEIHKEYTAICWGELGEEHGVVARPIGFATASAVYTKRGVDETGGQRAVTEFRLEKRFRGFSVVRLIPRTGRTHQLRVHMASLGHPVVGDKIYGLDDNWYLKFIEQGVTAEMLKELLLPRHALHAELVRLPHPRTQETREFHSPLPADMATFLSHMENP